MKNAFMANRKFVVKDSNHMTIDYTHSWCPKDKEVYTLYERMITTQIYATAWHGTLDIPFGANATYLRTMLSDKIGCPITGVEDDDDHDILQQFHIWKVFHGKEPRLYVYSEGTTRLSYTLSDHSQHNELRVPKDCPMRCKATIDCTLCETILVLISSFDRTCDDC